MLPILAAVCIASTDTVSPAHPLPIRAWQLHDYDLAYMLRMVDLAPDEGIGTIQLSHNIVHFVEQLLDEPERRRTVARVVDSAHQQGVQVHFWTHEFNDVPRRFVRDGRVDLDDDGLWTWMRGKYERVFTELVPAIDGVVLTFHETEVSVYDDGKVRSSLSRPARVTRLVDELADVCRTYGKELYVRTFVYRPDELAWVVEGVGAAAPDARVMTKCVPHDWQPFYPHNPALGRFPGRVQIVELDLASEYYGQGVVPYCFPDYVRFRLDYARSRGVAGAVARIDRMQRHAWGTPNWVNVMAFDRLLLDATRDDESIWREYAEWAFGPAAAPAAIEALKLTRPIIEQMYLSDRFYWLNGRSGVPSLDYAEAMIRMHSIAKWDPERYAATEAELLAPTERTRERLLAEKTRAIGLCREAIAGLEAARTHFAPEAYADLRGRFERLLRCARLWQAMADGYLSLRIVEQRPDRAAIDRAREALAGLRAECAFLASVAGPNAEWDNAEQAHRFADALEERLGAAVTGTPAPEGR